MRPVTPRQRETTSRVTGQTARDPSRGSSRRDITFPADLFETNEVQPLWQASDRWGARSLPNLQRSVTDRETGVANRAAIVFVNASRYRERHRAEFPVAMAFRARSD